MGVFSSANAERYNREAQRWVERGDWKKAASVFTKAKDAAPDDPISHYNLGLCLLQALQANVILDRVDPFLEAVELFRKAIALKPDYAKAWLALSKTLWYGWMVPSRTPQEVEGTKNLEIVVIGALANAIKADSGGPITQEAMRHLTEFLNDCDRPAPDSVSLAMYAIVCMRTCLDLTSGTARGTFAEDWHRNVVELCDRGKNQLGGDEETASTAPEGRVSKEKRGSLEKRRERRLREKKRRPRGAEGARGADRERAEESVETRKVTTYIHLPKSVVMPMPPVRDRAGYLRARRVTIDVRSADDLRARVAAVNMALRRSGQHAQADEFLGLAGKALTISQVLDAINTYADLNIILEGDEHQS